MTRRLLALLFVTFLVLGCNAPPSESLPEGRDAAPTLGIPMPTAEMLAALGPENDLPIQHLLPYPLFVMVGQPQQFFASPVGSGNEWIASGAIAQSLQLPYLNPAEMELFIHSAGIPIGVSVVIPSQDPNIPAQQQIIPVARRSTMITFGSPFDPSDFFAMVLGPGVDPDARKRTEGKTEYYDLTPSAVFTPQRLALGLVNERTIVIAEGTEEDIRFIFSDAVPQSAIYDRLKHTPIDASVLSVVASLEGLPVSPEMWNAMMDQAGQAGAIPAVLIPLLKQHLRAMTLSVNVTAAEGEPIVSLYVEGRDERSADAIAETIQGWTVSNQASLAVMREDAKSMLPIPAEFASALLNALSVNVVGTRVYVALNHFEHLIPTVAEGIRTQQTALQQEERQRRQLEALGLLATLYMMYYEETGTFPADIVDAEGMPVLSWRVALLPLMGRLFPQMGFDDLYRQFKLDEPWDSEDNKKLLDSMPFMFDSLSEDVESSKTVYRYFDSVGTPFSNRKLNVEEMKNPERTLMFVKVLPQHAVEWTKPVPMSFDMETLEDVVGSFLVGVTFSGQFCMIPILPQSDPQYDEWKRDIEMRVKGNDNPD